MYLLDISYYFICNFFPQQVIAYQVQISISTVSDWVSFCREVVIDYVEYSSKPLGGPGKTVEIYEAKFGKRKFNHGRRIEGTWVFGGFECKTKEILMVPNPDRSKETLIGYLKTWVLPGTHIISDCWAAYSNLKEEGYTHKIVNHTEHFVGPISGAYTQTSSESGTTLEPKSLNTEGGTNISASIWQFISSVENFQTSQIDSTLSGRLSLTSTSQRRAFKGKGIQCG